MNSSVQLVDWQTEQKCHVEQERNHHTRMIRVPRETFSVPDNNIEDRPARARDRWLSFSLPEQRQS